MTTDRSDVQGQEGAGQRHASGRRPAHARSRLKDSRSCRCGRVQFGPPSSTDRSPRLHLHPTRRGVGGGSIIPPTYDAAVREVVERQSRTPARRRHSRAPTAHGRALQPALTGPVQGEGLAASTIGSAGGTPRAGLRPALGCSHAPVRVYGSWKMYSPESRSLARINVSSPWTLGSSFGLSIVSTPQKLFPSGSR